MKTVAFLRGVNVGGRRIKMEELREALSHTSLGIVHTFLQSGNLLFSVVSDPEEVTDQIESVIQSMYGFKVPVILRTGSELKSIIDEIPFDLGNREEIKRKTGIEPFHIAFSESVITKKDEENMKKAESGKEQFRIVGKNIYLVLPDGVHKSKLASSISKLTTTVTMRNWNTVTKIQNILENTEF